MKHMFLRHQKRWSKWSFGFLASGYFSALSIILVSLTADEESILIPKPSLVSCLFKPELDGIEEQDGHSPTENPIYCNTYINGSTFIVKNHYVPTALIPLTPKTFAHMLDSSVSSSYCNDRLEYLDVHQLAL
jgi:hypothetical protein